MNAKRWEELEHYLQLFVDEYCLLDSTKIVSPKLMHEKFNWYLKFSTKNEMSVNVKETRQVVEGLFPTVHMLFSDIGPMYHGMGIKNTSKELDIDDFWPGEDEETAAFDSMIDKILYNTSLTRYVHLERNRVVHCMDMGYAFRICHRYRFYSNDPVLFTRTLRIINNHNEDEFRWFVSWELGESKEVRAIVSQINHNNKRMILAEFRKYHSDDLSSPQALVDDMRTNNELLHIMLPRDISCAIEESKDEDEGKNESETTDTKNHSSFDEKKDDKDISNNAIIKQSDMKVEIDNIQLDIKSDIKDISNSTTIEQSDTKVEINNVQSDTENDVKDLEANLNTILYKCPKFIITPITIKAKLDGHDLNTYFCIDTNRLNGLGLHGKYYNYTYRICSKNSILLDTIVSKLKKLGIDGSDVTLDKDRIIEAEKKYKNVNNSKMKGILWKEHFGESFKGKCYTCQEVIKYDIGWHMGHYLAKANGGDYTLENLVPMCSACNQSCGTRHAEVWRQMIRQFRAKKSTPSK